MIQIVICMVVVSTPIHHNITTALVITTLKRVNIVIQILSLNLIPTIQHNRLFSLLNYSYSNKTIIYRMKMLLRNTTTIKQSLKRHRLTISFWSIKKRIGLSWGIIQMRIISDVMSRINVFWIACKCLWIWLTRLVIGLRILVLKWIIRKIWLNF